ncbi:MAG: Trp biosynthesis-associated membrane protein, partial [Janthinobacterium lividum]
ESSGGLAQALALVVLAGALLGLVLRSRGRQVLGVLLVLAGAGVVVLGLTRSRPASGTVRTRVLEVSLADQFALVGTPWPYVFAVAGLLVVGAAGVMVLTASRWPSRAARYERPGAGPAQPSSATAVAADGLREDDPAALWRLLDAGVDPTSAGEWPEDPAEDHTDEQPDEDRSSGRAVVQEQPPGVTMNARAAVRTDEPT